MSVIERKIAPESIGNAVSYRSYGALGLSGFHHLQINHPELLDDGKNRINDIDHFCIEAKRVLHNHSGILKTPFLLPLKDCEFRFDYGTQKQRLKTLKERTEI